MNRQPTVLSIAESSPLVRGGLLQWKCACGQHTGGGGEREEYRKKKEVLQRSRGTQAEPATVPPVVHDVLSAPSLSARDEVRSARVPARLHELYDRGQP